MEGKLGRRRIENRVEHSWRGETAKRALLSLFALATSGCDLCLDPHHDLLERQEDERRLDAEAARKAETPEHKAHRQFREKLAALEDQGYTINLSGIYLSIELVSAASSGDIEEIEQFKYLLEGIDVKEDSADPLTSLTNQAANENNTVSVAVQQLHITNEKDGLKIRAENWLTDEQIGVFDFPQFNADKMDWNQFDTEQQARIDALKAALQRDKQGLVGAYGKLLTEHHVSLDKMDLMRTQPGDGMETILSLIKHSGFNSVTFNGFKRDNRVSNSPYINLTMTEANSAELPTTGTPEIAGTLSNVEMHRSFYGNDINGKPDWWNSRIPANQVVQDQYGNTIMITTERTLQPADEYSAERYFYDQFISISVPTEFLAETGSEADWHTWSVDLTTVGLPELHNVVATHVERPVAQETDVYGFKYNFYYQGDDTMTTDVYTGFYHAIEGGSSEIQRDFYGNDVDQQLTKNIVIVPVAEKNGSFTPRNSTTIALTNEHLRIGESDYFEVKSTARHETAHAMFNHLRLIQSPEVTRLHARLSQDFFKAINESNWETNGFGGHSQDNATEFFASFINGLYVGDLEATMHAKLTPATAAEYADAAKTLRTELGSILRKQNDRYETIGILEELAKAERIANSIAAGQ